MEESVTSGECFSTIPKIMGLISWKYDRLRFGKLPIILSIVLSIAPESVARMEPFTSSEAKISLIAIVMLNLTLHSVLPCASSANKAF